MQTQQSRRRKKREDKDKDKDKEEDRGVYYASPGVTRSPVKARMSPPCKAMQERLIRQCLQRVKSQRRKMIEASRARVLSEKEIFRDLLFEQMQQTDAHGNGSGSG